jgi:hypothetical protein
MKKRLVIVLSVLLVASGGIYLLRGQLWEGIKNTITADMFVEADTDDFDPGVAIGSTFPAIQALYQGQEINDVQPFVHDKGMVFIANRSADW